MNVGDYLKALEQSGVKNVSTSNLDKLHKLYVEHVLPKPQRLVFANLKRRIASTSKVKRIKVVRKNVLVKEDVKKVSSLQTSGHTHEAGKSPSVRCEDAINDKPCEKRVKFSSEVTVSTFEKPKFQKTAVSWP